MILVHATTSETFSEDPRKLLKQLWNVDTSSPILMVIPILVLTPLVQKDVQRNGDIPFSCYLKQPSFLEPFLEINSVILATIIPPNNLDILNIDSRFTVSVVIPS